MSEALGYGRGAHQPEGVGFPEPTSLPVCDLLWARCLSRKAIGRRVGRRRKNARSDTRLQRRRNSIRTRLDLGRVGRCRARAASSSSTGDSYAREHGTSNRPAQKSGPRRILLQSGGEYRRESRRCQTTYGEAA